MLSQSVKLVRTAAHSVMQITQ